jgi:UDP-GlcNAc3NAcA epimerase
MRLLTILGARPQFIKAAALHRVIRERCSGTIREAYLHTGQHYDERMTNVFFRELDLPVPNANLRVGSGSAAFQLGSMMMGIEGYLREHRPDMVLVYGDTNSTLAGALAASRLAIPVAHVEAGLRSRDKRMQEEVNRLMTDHASTLLFPPTPTAVANLQAEGLTGGPPPHAINNPRLAAVGDVMLDNLLHYLPRATPPAAAEELPERFSLVTAHRAETVHDRDALDELCRALLAFRRLTNDPLVMPLHPGTRMRLDTGGPGARALLADPDVVTTQPASYLEMLWLLGRASRVLTDSGGLQKEACWAGKPCLVLRSATEWVELVEAGVSRVAGTTETSLLAAAAMPEKADPEAARAAFGGGTAAEHICEMLIEFHEQD